MNYSSFLYRSFKVESDKTAAQQVRFNVQLTSYPNHMGLTLDQNPRSLCLGTNDEKL